MAPQPTVTHLPFLVEVGPNGIAREFDPQLEAAIAVSRLDPKQVTTDTWITRMSWPFALMALDRKTLALFDLLGLSQVVVPDYPPSCIMPLVRQVLATPPSLDHLDDYLSKVKALSNLPGYAGKPQQNELTACLPTKAVPSELATYVGVLTDSRFPLDRTAQLPTTVAEADARKMAETLQGTWQTVNGDIGNLSTALARMLSQDDPWLRLIQSDEKEIRKTCDERVAQIRPDVNGAIAEAKETMEQERHKVDVRLSPEIAILEADILRLSHQDAGNGKKGTTGGQRGAANAKRKAEEQLDRMREELERLTKQIDDRYQTVVDTQTQRIKQHEDERDRRLSPLHKNHARIQEAYHSAARTLTRHFDARKRHRQLLGQAVLERPGTAQAPEDPTWRIVAIPFWLIAEANAWPRTARCLFPDLIAPNGSGWATVRKLLAGQGIPLLNALRPFATKQTELLRARLMQESELGNRVAQMAEKGNLLRNSAMVAEFEFALSELAKRNWISQRKATTLLATLREGLSAPTPGQHEGTSRGSESRQNRAT